MNPMLQKLVAVLCLATFGLLGLNFYNAPVEQDIGYKYLHEGCEIPLLNPWDPSIMSYHKEKQELSCKQIQYELTKLLENGSLIFNESELAKISGSLVCSYRCYRKQDGSDNVLDYKEWIQFNSSVVPGCEFVEVSCQRDSLPHTVIYCNNHNQVIKRVTVSRKPIRSGSAEFQPFRPGVIIFVMDSISHSSWIRDLPKSFEVIKSKYQSYIFDGMTKVGDHSFPNAVAFLAGKQANTEFGDVKGFFDNHPLIWKDFKAQDYTTYYAEDYPDYNLFYYLAKGFARKPVDHYFRPFWWNVYGSYVHRRSTNLCYGNHKMHNLELNYLGQFLKKYKGEPIFALNWLTELGHDYAAQASMGDNDIAAFLEKHLEYVKDSFVFILADHGHRFDAIRETSIGRLEERMPFFSMKIPDRLRNTELDKIIKDNTGKLTSFWDFYATMKDILYMGKEDVWHEVKELEFSFELQKERNYSDKGMSLLRPIPARNCKEAHIAEEFCICTKETEIEVGQPIVQKCAQTVLDEINRLLSGNVKCARLRLSTVKSATKLQSVSSQVQDLRVALEAEPSGGIFEGLVRFHSRTNRYQVIGDINRINRYGNQSICVETQLLRKYCYCL